MFLKFASRRNRLNSSWNCSICVKKRFWVITSEFSALPENFFVFLWYLSSFVWALTTASQAKLFRFVLQHLFGRTKFSVTYNGEGAAFVLEGCVPTLLRQQCWELLRACWQWSANGCNSSQQCWDLQCIVGRIQPTSLCKPCVMSVRGPKNVGRAVQTDPTWLRHASAITEQKKYWELLAEQQCYVRLYAA